MTRIGFMLATTGTGGSERYLLRLIGLLPPEVRPFVFVRAAEPGDLHGHFVAAGAEPVYLPIGYADPRRMLALWRRFRAARLDALVDLTGIFGGVPLALARMAGVQRRVAFHRRSTYAFAQTPARRLFAAASRRLVEASATAILSNSRAALMLFHPRLLDRDPRLRVFANLIDPGELQPRGSRADLRRALELPAHARIVLHIGRLDPAKDHPTLLRALATAMERDPRVHAVLAGPGTETLATRDDLVPPALRGRFRFLGNRGDIGDLHAASDLFLFPSITEGQPNALLEAMVSGLPVVASDIAPIREVVPERGWPTLIPPGDADGFARAVIACGLDPAEADTRRFRDEAVALTDPAANLPRLFEMLIPC